MCPLKSTSFYTHVFSLLDSSRPLQEIFPDGVRLRSCRWEKLDLLRSFPLIRGLIIGLCFHLGAPFKASSIGGSPFCHNGENVFRTQMMKGFGGILGILVICKDLCHQFTTGKSSIVILTCNIWVSIQPWVDDTGDIGTTRPTNHPREIDSCAKGMLPSILEQQMEESDYL